MKPPSARALETQRALRRTGGIALLWLCLLPTSALAQRQLHWDSLEVSAHLNADGTLTVTEIQDMVFTGEWNGGERQFNIRPRQQLSLTSVSREVGGVWRDLSQDSSLNDVDDYSMTDAHTLRWRSRMPDDPPFSATPMRYRIRYVLSGILLKEDETYRLDHDFAFPDREGPITRFELALTLDPAWRPEEPVRRLYTAGPLPPGDSFVLTLPLRYSGDGVPEARDTKRPQELVIAVSAILGVTLFAIAGWFIREQRYGRFAPLAHNVDEAWLREHILKHPAEVVAAAWDENVGTAEVVALLARMEAEGKLESSVGKGKKSTSMTMRLIADRSDLNAHERALIDKLFFDHRSDTSTSAVRAHYRTKGFNPADEIRPALEAAVDALLPPMPKRRRFSPLSILLLIAGSALVIYKWTQGYPGGFPVLLPMLVVAGAGWVTGLKCRSYLHWGLNAAILCLLPTMVIALGTAAYLWYRAGTGLVELAPHTAYGIAAVALAYILSCVNAMKSRRSPEAIAFRKRLTAGRAYFMEQLKTAEPALRDEWYPWLLGLELNKQVDAWSIERAPSPSSSTSRSTASHSTSFGSSGASTPSFAGFTGGRAGGAGASSSWHAAAVGMAATVSPPSSSGSGGGSSSGGSSSGGSSGGGGGGGW